MQKAKHSKFRNTGILFELLTRQITADILAGKDESPAKTLLFKYFSENTELGQEWQLYNFLINERAKDEKQADRYLDLTLTQLSKINQKKLSVQKYNLIKELNEHYAINTLLKSNIKTYRLLASVYKLFENSTNVNIKFGIDEIANARNCVCEHLSGIKNAKPSEADETLELYKKQSEDIRLLTYKLMVDHLNERYKGLDESQKYILREYINNITNSNSLTSFISTEVLKIKNELSKLNDKVDSNVVKIKITETVKQLENMKPTGAIKDNQIMVLLLSHELIKEIKSKL